MFVRFFNEIILKLSLEGRGNMNKGLAQKGFSLVDLTMVLVVVALMVGAVIKGQAMISDAKHKRLMNDLQGISAAYFTYFERYNAIPGDDSDNHEWTGIRAGDGDDFIAGDNNHDGTESHEAWQALRHAGLLSGDPGATGDIHLPGNPCDGKYSIGSRHFGARVGHKNYISADNISGSIAELVDMKYDDGVYGKGTIQSDREYTSATVQLFYAL